MATELTAHFDPASLRSGIYVASSTSDAYGDLLAAIVGGHASFVGEHIDPRGVKMVAARVGRGGNPSIGISQAFFTTVLKDYADWREKWWREAIQNSVDAGASRITCEMIVQEDGNVRIAVEDNGGGMTEDILLNKFLMLGGSTKKSGSGAAGGFGKAKELLILPWISWSVHSRDMFVTGGGIDYETERTSYLSGTRLEVLMPADQHTSEAAAIAFINKCDLPRVDFVVNKIADGRTTTHNPRADLRGSQLIEEVPGKAEVYYTNVDYHVAYMYVRVKGLYMFGVYTGEIPGKQLICEITAPSIDIFTANRDGFRDWDVRNAIDKLVERFSKDTLSAINAKKGLIRKKFQGKGKFQAERAQSDALSQIPYLPPTDSEGVTSIDAYGIKNIAEVIATFQTRVSRETDGPLVSVPDRALAAELLGSVEYLGAEHVEQSVMQLAWDPDFYVVNEIEEFGVPAKFMPETMKPQIVKLARTWTEMCRFVLMQLGNFRPFGVGWIFSNDARAAFLDEDREKWLLLNPFKNRSRSDLWTPTNVRDLKHIYALAVHECTHLADGIDYHDESFAAALTENIAKTADGFRKIRKIVGAIRMRDAAVADVTSRAANPDALTAQLVRRLLR